MAFLSERYCLEHGYTLQNSGVLSMSLDRPKENFYDIQDDISLNENQTFQGWISLSSSSGSLYAMVILLVFFIIGSGYLLIYNVLYISISRDTRFYGLIKTLGTTERQIKTLVKRQAVEYRSVLFWQVSFPLELYLFFWKMRSIAENLLWTQKYFFIQAFLFYPYSSLL